VRLLYLLVMLVLIALLFLMVAIPNARFAHRDGRHIWHSCPSNTGSYVCGDLSIDTYCPDRQSFLPRTWDRMKTCFQISLES